MTSHELAKKLLEGPDLPVQVRAGAAKDTVFCDPGEAFLRTDLDDSVIVVEGWASNTELLVEQPDLD